MIQVIDLIEPERAKWSDEDRITPGVYREEN